MKYLLALLLPVLVMCDMEDKPRWDIEKVEWPQDLSKMEDIPKMDSTKFFEGRLWYATFVSDDSIGIEALDKLDKLEMVYVKVFFVKGEKQRSTMIEKNGKQYHSIPDDSKGNYYLFAETDDTVGVANGLEYQQKHNQYAFFGKPETSKVVRYGKYCQYMREESLKGEVAHHYWIPRFINLDMAKINNPDHPLFDKGLSIRGTYNVVTHYSILVENKKKYLIRVLYKIEPCKLRDSDFSIPDKPQKRVMEN